MKKKKIAICSAQVPFNYGGAEILVEELKRQLILKGFDAEIINIPFKWYPHERLIDEALVWALTDLTESNGEKIDMVICTKYPTYTVQHPNKIVWLFHQHRAVYDLLDTPYSGFTKSGNDLRIINHVRDIDNKYLNQVQKIFTISANVSQRLSKFNGIESEVLYPPTKLEGMYREAKSEKYIFSAGRLDPMKRLELMLHAMKYIDPEYKFLIAGRGGHEAKLLEIVKKEKIENRVVFLGFVDDEQLIDYYSKASLVFFVPMDEDYGYITIESFLSGKPVITTKDSGGVLEFVKDGVNGIVANPDSMEIGQRVNELLSNNMLIQKYGEEGKQTVAQINWDFVIKELTKTLDS